MYVKTSLLRLSFLLIFFSLSHPSRPPRRLLPRASPRRVHQVSPSPSLPGVIDAAAIPKFLERLKSFLGETGKEYGCLLMEHLTEDLNDLPNFSDGVPKEGARVDDVLVRIGIIQSIEEKLRTFETHCGSLSQYGMKHMRSNANICNAGIKKETMAKVSAEVCDQIPSTSWSSLHRGFSA